MALYLLLLLASQVPETRAEDAEFSTVDQGVSRHHEHRTDVSSTARDESQPFKPAACGVCHPPSGTGVPET